MPPQNNIRPIKAHEIPKLGTMPAPPLSNKIWGDCSRSFVVESGKVKSEGEIKNQEFVEGLKVEREL